MGTGLVVLEGLKRRWHGLEERYTVVAVAAAVQQRFNEVHGGYVASAVTLAAFVSIFPLILVTVAVLGFISSGNHDVTRSVLDALAIPSSSEAAKTVSQAIATAEESRKAASVVGLAGLLWSSLGLVAALQYAYDTVWQITGRGIRDKLTGLLWLVGSAGLFVASFALTAGIQFLPGFLAPIEIVLALGLGFGLFLWAAKILPNQDIGWRPLVPGAILGAVGFEVLKVLGGIYVPRAVASSSALYGSLGVVFAILAWLFFFARLFLYSAVLNVVMWERGHGTVTIELDVPNIPGRNMEEEGTRSGDAVPAG
ncbi:MAG: putative rane protein [Actinomycetia bacterium]|nr:putative rane protein [Actinomycetes bacterium]